MPRIDRKRPDLLLLLSLLLVILTSPELDPNRLGRLVLLALTFVPVTLATIRLSEIKGWVRPTVALVAVIAIVGVASLIWPTRALLGMKWMLLVVFFGLSVVGLFSYLKNARSINEAHLYTAVSIYLMLGMMWFALYSAIDIFFPGAIFHGSTAHEKGPSDLLYFSLVTLSTIGYGDIVPVHPEVRMLAALEGVTGVLFIAITIAILVSSFRRRNESD